VIKIYARGSRRAEVLIHEAIGEDWFGNGLTSKRFVQELNDLGEVDEILVRINSPGGAVFDGVAIYNALKEHPARIDVLVEGLAASIASVIARKASPMSTPRPRTTRPHRPCAPIIAQRSMRGALDSMHLAASRRTPVPLRRIDR